MMVSDVLFPEMDSENQNNLKKLKEELQKKRKKETWMLCLGAGVSISAGLPNWYGLLAKITAQTLPTFVDREIPDDIMGNLYYKDIKEFYKNLSYEGSFLNKVSDSFDGKYDEIFANINVLESAEYIRNFLEDSLKYSLNDDERNGGNFNKRIDYHMNCQIQQAFATKDIPKTKTTLAAVARLMKSEKDHLIHNAITYNYDNLLETYLRSECGCMADRVHSIVKGDELRDFDTRTDWNIYHVHGRVPVVEYPGEDMSDKVILTESDYYQEEQINYSWTNILQSYAMLRANLIYIGFSGTDYNFRRIIKYVNKEKASAHERFIFFSVNDIVKAVFTKEIASGKKLDACIRVMNSSSSEYAFERLFINYLIYAQTVYWEKHGIKVIWSSHEELYEDLEKLH